MTAFQDNKGRRFTCVGYAGKKYGPTMIWQVHHTSQLIIPPDAVR